MPLLVYMLKMILGRREEGNLASHPLISLRRPPTTPALGSHRRSILQGEAWGGDVLGGYRLLSSEDPTAQGEDAKSP